MTIGRSNKTGSETRVSVSWNVERAPNSGRNCFGRTSREAGHSRVPAPPHMINGIIRRSIIALKPCVASNLIVVAIPCDKIADAVLDRDFGSEARVTHQIADIREGLQYITRLHRQHFLCRRAAELLLEERDHMLEFLRPVIADIVNPGRRVAGSRIIAGNAIDQLRYHTGHVVDMGEVAAHFPMVKEPDRLTFDDGPCEQEDRHVRTAPWTVDGKEPQARHRKPIQMTVGMREQLVC